MSERITALSIAVIILVFVVLVLGWRVILLEERCRRWREWFMGDRDGG